MIRNILALVFNDLAVTLKNKTVYLVLFIPCFVFISLKLVDSAGAIGELKIALIEDYAYAPSFARSVKAARGNIEIHWVQNKEEGMRLLEEKKIDGVLQENEKKRGSLELLVLKKESLKTLAVVQMFSALQKSTERHSADWISNVKALQEGDIQRQTLPTWILMLILLVGFIILPAQVAEEKEKNLILALLQTPVREVEWLTAKLLTGMTLISVAILSLHLLEGFRFAHFFDYAAFIVVGSYCFSAYGIFLGFLCRTQASARTLGVVFYLPHLLPSALSEYSKKLTGVAPFLPSYHLYEPLKSILLEDGRTAGLTSHWMCLFLVGSATFYFAYLLMKKRWLM